MPTAYQPARRRASGGYAAWFNAIVSVLGLRVLGSGIAFAGNIVVARRLGPDLFGQFYLLFAIMTVVAGVTGPALDTSLVRFAARHIGGGPDAPAPYFKAMLYAKCMVFAGTMLCGLLFAQPLLALLFSGGGSPGFSRGAVVLAFFGGSAVSMWGFAQSYFQAYQRFNFYAGFEFCSSSLRLALIVALYLAGVRHVVPYLAAYVAAPAAMWVFSWLLLPPRIFRASTNAHAAGELFRFVRWVLLAALFTTVTQRIDLLLLGAYGMDEAVVGRYGAAVSLALLGELVLLTFYNVLLPKASALRQAGELRRFIGSFRIPSLLFCLVMSLLMYLAPWLSLFFFGPSYAGTEDFFVVLLAGIIVALACAPATTAIYALGRSRMMAGFEAVRFLLTLGLALYVIPRHGAYGVAWVVTGVRASVSLAMYLVAHQMVKRMAIRESLAQED